MQKIPFFQINFLGLVFSFLILQSLSEAKTPAARVSNNECSNAATNFVEHIKSIPGFKEPEDMSRLFKAGPLDLTQGRHKCMFTHIGWPTQNGNGHVDCLYFAQSKQGKNGFPDFPQRQKYSLNFFSNASRFCENQKEKDPAFCKTCAVYLELLAFRDGIRPLPPQSGIPPKTGPAISAPAAGRWITTTTKEKVGSE